MGSRYAGILGPLAFSAVLIRGALSGNGLNTTVPFACATLFLFACIGWVGGRIAQRVVVESVRMRVNEQLQATGEGTDDVAANATSQ